MFRSSDALPCAATHASWELIQRMRTDIMRLDGQEHERRGALVLLKDEIRRLPDEQSWRRIAASAPFNAPFQESPAERRARETERQRALDAFDQKFSSHQRELYSERSRLAAAHAEAEEELAVAEKRVRELERARKGAEGLAPWDRMALDALRFLGELPTRCASDDAMMKGAEVVALAAKRLGVSRSLYYQQLRPLLKEHYLMPAQWISWKRERTDRLAASAKRFRQDEVEALFRFAQTGSVLVRTAP